MTPPSGSTGSANVAGIGVQRFVSGSLPTAKSNAMSPRVRGPLQRMVSSPVQPVAAPALDAGIDQLQRTMPGVGSEHNMNSAVQTGMWNMGRGGGSPHHGGNATPAAVSGPLSPSRASLGPRSHGAVGAHLRKRSADRVGGSSIVAAPAGASPQQQQAAPGMPSPQLSATPQVIPAGHPMLHGHGPPFFSTPSMVPSHAWGPLPHGAGMSPRVLPSAATGYHSGNILASSSSHSPRPLHAQMVAASQRRQGNNAPGAPPGPARQVSGELRAGLVRQVSGRRASSPSVEVAVAVAGGTGTHTPANPAVGRAAMPAAPRTLPARNTPSTGSSHQASRTHIQDAPQEQDPTASGDLRAQLERGGGGPGSALAEVAAIARECKDAKLETEFLRRIEALEAKVGDRDSLVAKLSRQQARLDRLEILARENERLKALMRTGGKGVVKDRRPGVNRQASGRLRTEERAPEVRIMTMRDQEMVVRQPSVEPAEARSAEQSIQSKAVPSGSLSGKQVSHSRSGTNLHQTPLGAHPPGVRRLVSAPPQELSAQPVTIKTAEQQPSELECRLEELELALGLQPGACSKPQTQRPNKDHANGVFRERSV